MMKRFLAVCILLTACLTASAQSSKMLSIQDCYTLSRLHYPLLKQSSIIARSTSYSLQNLSKAWNPMVTLNGQASYQSDVTEISIKLPNVYIESPDKDQYKLFAEVNQSLYDGGVNKYQKHLIENAALIEEQKLEIELYRLRERINQLFFGILLLDEQLKQVQITQKDIQSGVSKVEGAVANGAALKSSVDVLQAELLKIHQRKTELGATRKSYLDMLGLFINRQLDANTSLEVPSIPSSRGAVNRPELRLYELQIKNAFVQDSLIHSKNLPKIGLFLQAGIGKPALNFLKNSFQAYYIGGIRVSWPLSGLYTEKTERQQQGLIRQLFDIQKETFLFNTGISLSKQAGDLEKTAELIKTDNEIIRLRERIKNTANAQLTYGTITTNDYLREVYAEDQARQSLLLHQVELLMNRYNYSFISGNQP